VKKILIAITMMTMGCTVKVVRNCDGVKGNCVDHSSPNVKPRPKEQFRPRAKPKKKKRRSIEKYRSDPPSFRIPPYTPKRMLPKTEDEEDLEKEFKKDKKRKKKKKKRLKKKTIILV
jgi:hypothetical protein